MRNDLPPRYHSYALLVLGLVAVWLASGCMQKPRIVYKTVEVQVPVTTPCITVLDVPQLPSGLEPMPTDANAALSLSLAQNFRWNVYGWEADRLLRICAGVDGLQQFAPVTWGTGQAAGAFEPYLVEIPGGYQLVTPATGRP